MLFCSFLTLLCQGVFGIFLRVLAFMLVLLALRAQQLQLQQRQQ